MQVKILEAVKIQAAVLKHTLIQDMSDAWKERVWWNCLSARPAQATKTPKGEASSTAPSEEVASVWELRLPKSDSASEQQTLTEV